MRVGWLCPFVDDPKTCVGAVIETDPLPGVRSEYIPVILPEMTLDEALQADQLWLLSMVADPLLAFRSRVSAEAFLFDTFAAFMSGVLNPDYVEYLLEHHNGFVRQASEYGLVIPIKPTNLN